MELQTSYDRTYVQHQVTHNGTPYQKVVRRSKTNVADISCLLSDKRLSQEIKETEQRPRETHGLSQPAADLQPWKTGRMCNV